MQYINSDVCCLYMDVHVISTRPVAANKSIPSRKHEGRLEVRWVFHVYAECDIAEFGEAKAEIRTLSSLRRACW